MIEAIELNECEKRRELQVIKVAFPSIDDRAGSGVPPVEFENQIPEL
jgi:hypothetical protein